MKELSFNELDDVIGGAGNGFGSGKPAPQQHLIAKGVQLDGRVVSTPAEDESDASKGVRRMKMFKA